MTWIIYQHKNKINNKVYIGQTCQKTYQRWRNGEGYIGSPKFYKAIQKYGWENFEHIILKDNIQSQEEADYLEKYYIKNFNSINDNFGYNISEGGNAEKLSEETKEKIRQTKIKNNSIYHPTEEHKKKLSQMYSGKGNPFYGKKHSEETRKKMSENHADFKGGKSSSAKKVMCVETGEIFPSATEAGTFCGRKNSAINNCISGRSKTCGGYHWKRILEEDGE